MSVLVRGMEMPKNCRECNFCNELNFEGYLWFDFYCRAKDKSFDLDKNKDKPDWCPLIEVPTPHGRLIDANKATEESMKRTGKRLLAIDTAPTIIEAEGSEDG